MIVTKPLGQLKKLGFYDAICHYSNAKFTFKALLKVDWKRGSNIVLGYSLFVPISELGTFWNQSSYLCI